MKVVSTDMVSSSVLDISNEMTESCRSIDYVLDSFISDTRVSSSKDVVDMHQYIIATLKKHINMHAEDTLMHNELLEFKGSNKLFSTVFSADNLVPVLEKFFRYCLYFEENATEYMRHCFNTVIFRLVHWLYQYDYITEFDYKHFYDILDKISEAEDRARLAASELVKWLSVREVTLEALSPSQKYEVVQTLGENIWLAPQNKNFCLNRSIKVARSIVGLLEVGWTLEGVIDSRGPKPELITLTQIYPTLPSSC